MDDHAEIEAVRSKIAENERLLGKIEASPVEIHDPGDTESADEQGCYVYGIVNGDDGLLDELSVSGIDPGYPLNALPYGSIQAIVSKVSLREFGQDALKANLGDIGWLAAKVYAHQTILERAAVGRTIVPMRFCTIYRSESRVMETLAEYYDDFEDNLARLEGKQEWGIKVYVDRNVLAGKIAEISETVRDLEAQMTEKSSGTAYFLKKKLEAATDEEMERISGECAQRSHDRLAGRAVEAVVTPLLDNEVTGRKDEMIFNGAYLAAEEQLTAFHAELESLWDDYGGYGFSYEVSGPWPPYNFVIIGPRRIAEDEPIGDKREEGHAA